MLSKLLRPFTYWSDFWTELKIFRVFRQSAYQNKKMLEKDHGLRVDWLGRIYGVVNLPEEVAGAAEQIQQAYVLQQITKYGNVMMKIGLADIVYPEISRVEGSTAYLVVLWPVYDHLNFWYFIGNLIRSSIVITILYFLIRIIISNSHYLWEYLLATIDVVKGLI